MIYERGLLTKFKIQNSKFKIQKILNTKKYKSLNVIYAELSGDFPLGDSRQPTYKSLRPFDLVS